MALTPTPAHTTEPAHARFTAGRHGGMDGGGGWSGGGDPALRRVRYGALTAVLITALAACCLIAGVIGQRFHARWDVTATREHTLSDRTLRVVAGLREPHEILVSADVGRFDRRSWQRVTDLLSAFAQAGPNIKVSTIDTGAPGADRAFEGVIARFAEQRAADIQAASGAVFAAAADTGRLAEESRVLADQLSALASAADLPEADRQALRERAQILAVHAADAAKIRAEVAAAATRQRGRVTLPEGDTAAQAAKPLNNAATTLQSIATTAERLLAAARPDAPSRQPLQQAGRAAADLARRARLITDSLDRLRPLEPLLVARLLQAQEAVLLIGPRGVSAVELTALFPAEGPGGPLQTSEARVRFAGEELIGTALASLVVPEAPIVAFVHAERERLFDPRGNVNPAAGIAKLVERLRLRRTDAAEWAVALDRQRPDFAAIRTARDGRPRPIVWFVVGPPAQARGNDPRAAAAMADRAQRLADLGKAISLLVDDRQNVLITIVPSELPAVGQTDPMVEALASLGVKADSGRPLITGVSTTAGIQPQFFQTLRAAETANIIGRALNGLAVQLPWATPIALPAPPADGLRAEPILVVPASPDTRGVAQWQNLARARQMPAPDTRRDNLTGPWTVAAAIERAETPTLPRQRLVAVAGALWFVDELTQQAAEIEGRLAAAFPGNTELIDASLHWLAGQDELISPTPQARDIPRIAQIDPVAALALRWFLIAGLPVLVLGIGAAWRLLRG
ncbi:MAG: hypothetical protein IBJ11_11575 [Phycisphaerales bacterium]|nr:hypothetical protein [Phycisphaerales bacterium]